MRELTLNEIKFTNAGKATISVDPGQLTGVIAPVFLALVGFTIGGFFRDDRAISRAILSTSGGVVGLWVGQVVSWITDDKD